jgi:ketosteroid isomerase-like protein
MANENIAVVRGLYEAWSRGDMDAFLATLAPDVEWRFADNFVYGQVNPVIGRDMLREGSLKRLKTEWQEFDGVPDEILDAGDTVVGLGHYVGTHKATGKRLNAQFAHIFTLADGQVTRWRQYVDTKQFADVTKP